MERRSEMFFLSLSGATEVYFPKPAGPVRPVRFVRIFMREDLYADPYTFKTSSKVSGLSNVRLTLRTKDNAELLVNAPGFMFFTGDPTGTGRFIRPERALANLPLDPQRCSAFLDFPGKVGLAVQFVYE